METHGNLQPIALPGACVVSIPAMRGTGIPLAEIQAGQRQLFWPLLLPISLVTSKTVGSSILATAIFMLSYRMLCCTSVRKANADTCPSQNASVVLIAIDTTIWCVVICIGHDMVLLWFLMHDVPLPSHIRWGHFHVTSVLPSASRCPP